ncbi:MAG: ribonuclease D [Anaerolineales bacterium]|nr:ribonuclease D [Anaerolineales bacterium]
MMAGSNLPRAKLITRPDDLVSLVDRLSGHSIIAVDTESNSLFAYQEQVCLIQFSIPHQDILVDPLVLKDLSPLGPLFANPEIEKVFHAAEYDLICLKRDFGFTFENLFDTMLAARILGWGELGLGALLKEHFDVEMDKRHQQANWGKRPLPDNLLAYAQLDTHFLIPLRHHLETELKAAGRWVLAEEDFKRLRNVNGRNHTNGVDACWRIGGAYDLTAQQAAVLKELCLYRDQMAKSMNRPLFKVINDRTLLAIAAAAPADLEELRRLPGMTPRQVQRHGRALLRAVDLGLRSEPLYPPRSPRPNDQFITRLEVLRQWRKHAAHEMGVSSDVVLPRDLLFAIATHNPKNKAELGQILNEVPWRMERFGEQILERLVWY